MRRVLVEVVDEDEVEVGGGGHLAPAELAHGDDDRAAARHAAVRSHHLALHLGLHGGDDAFGQQRVGAAGLGGGDGAGQHAHADQELLLAGEQAGAIEHLLEVGGTLELGGDQGIEAGAVGQAAEEARIEHGIERAPALAQDAREPRRRAHDGGQQLEQARVLLQEREQLHAGRQLGQEAVEADEGRDRDWR